MQITIFKNQTFYYCILALLGCLIVYNCYIILTFQEIWGFLPIVIQAVIIGLIITKHQFARIALKVWAIIFLILGSSLQIIGQLVQDIFEQSTVDPVFYIVTGINLLIGSLVVYYTNTTVVVETVDKSVEM